MAGIGIPKYADDLLRFERQELPDSKPNPHKKYDFIIVGGGSAGAALANRLSEDPNAEVLLLEAGGNENLVMDLPLLVNALQALKTINWDYETEPSDHYCLAMKDHKCKWPRGKVMGGSSVLNYMIATRGDPRDYDNWAKMGCDGWSYEELLPYFKKLESNVVPEFENDTKLHGHDGPLTISYPPFRTPLVDAFVKGGQAMGYKKIDYNGGEDTMGFNYVQATLREGERCSTNRAFLHPLKKNRPNLYVSKNSLVSKVIFSGKKAIGVQYEKRGKIRSVYAKNEVILSAGSIGSAQILMLSGIGHKKHLEDIGIEVLMDLPVGDNLMDHIGYGGLMFMVNESVAITLYDMIDPSYPYMKDFFNHKTGPLTIPGGIEGLGFIDADNLDNTGKDGYPNVELMFIGGAPGTNAGIRTLFGITEATWEKYYEKIVGKYAWTAFPLLLRPKSRGWIRLRDKDINTKPKIVANYMNHTEDVKVLIKGIRATIKLARTKPMRKFESKLLKPNFPHCNKFKYDSDDYWECAVRTMTFNIYHYTGTCKMGAKDDPTSVVDPELKVLGVEGLRVVDGSVMPQIVSAHTNVPIVMIAEKAADLIKKEWRYK
ncbi:glucose dehydrogenase [FAD, quinone]-like isoform X2 [Prorops nasuta]